MESGNRVPRVNRRRPELDQEASRWGGGRRVQVEVGRRSAEWIPGEVTLEAGLESQVSWREEGQWY